MKNEMSPSCQTHWCRCSHSTHHGSGGGECLGFRQLLSSYHLWAFLLSQGVSVMSHHSALCAAVLVAPLAEPCMRGAPQSRLSHGSMVSLRKPTGRTHVPVVMLHAHTNWPELH